MTTLRKVVFGTLLFVPFAATYADFKPESWARVRDILLPPLGAPAYVRVPLDRDVASGSAGFRDLRIIREQGIEIPYQLLVEDEAVTSEYAPSRTLDVATDRAGRLMFILDLGRDGVLHSRLNIETATPNYRRQVSIFSASRLLSHDSPSWNLLTDDGYVFKFSDTRAGFVSARGEVSYPESSARYLRVVVESGPEGALSFSSTGVYRYSTEAAELLDEDVRAEVNELRGEQATEIIVDLGAADIPTRELTFFVQSTGNFSRPVRLFGGSDGKTWSRVGSGYISHIETPKFSGGNSGISYPESIYRYYRAVVENFDDTPLSFAPRAVLTGVLRTVVFEATPNERPMLYYGTTDAYAPRYDLARYFAYLDTTALPEARLGAARENPDYVPPPPPVVPFTERNKVLLNVTLALLIVIIVAIVFFYIWRHTRRGKSVPPAAPPTSSLPEAPLSNAPNEPQPPQNTAS